MKKKQRKIISAVVFMLSVAVIIIGFFLMTNTDGKPVSPVQTGNPGSEPDQGSGDGGVQVTDSATIDGMTEDIVNNMTLEEKVGQMFVVGLENLDTGNGNYYEFRAITPDMQQTITQYKPGGVFFFSRNIESREQTKQLISDLAAASDIPLFFTVDEEGGDVSRIAGNPNMKTTLFPSMEEVGLKQDTEYAYEMGKTIGSQIRELGFNVDFAPVADVKTNQLNTEIGNRSFGADPELVSSMVTAVVKGIQENDVSATLKHFPGHGNSSEDSHKTAVNVDNDLNRLRKVDFVPFRAGIKEGADFVMVSHISVSRVTEDTVPACMSSLMIQTVLRKELGFDGIAITDAMDMGAITKYYEPDEAAVNCVEAGMDMILLSTDYQSAYRAVLGAVQDGKIEETRIDESVKRIIRVKIKRGLILSDTDLLDSRTGR